MKVRMISAKEIVGKTITAFDPGAWLDGDGTMKHSPRITLSDGSVLYFRTEELEDGSAYGTFIGRAKP